MSVWSLPVNTGSLFFNILEDEINVHLTHPKYVKAIKGKTTDKKDSKWICALFKHDLIKFSFIPPKEIRELREIARYRYKLVCMRSSEVMNDIGV